jgi:peptide/nickel transport system permease protein
VGSLFFSSVPPFALGIILLFLIGVKMQILPIGGAYSFGLTPELSASFFGDAITYWWLPFWSVVLVFIGGQAVGMRSMAIYELGSDYVNYNRGLGVKESYTVSYIFRNAMLPQVTGLALAIAGIIAGSLIAELVFSYPGLGTLLFTAIGANDYPVIQGITLLITITVVIANFAVDVITGFIDPRIRASQTGDR